jgi:hypothetical protein
MDNPKMFEPYQAAADIDVVPSYFPIPGLGILSVKDCIEDCIGVSP